MRTLSQITTRIRFIKSVMPCASDEERKEFEEELEQLARLYDEHRANKLSA